MISDALHYLSSVDVLYILFIYLFKAGDIPFTAISSKITIDLCC